MTKAQEIMKKKQFIKDEMDRQLTPVDAETEQFPLEKGYKAA